MVPITKIATAGKIMGGSLAIKGTAFAATGGAAASDTLKKIGDKWPGEKTSVTGGSFLENLIDWIFGVPGVIWDAGVWVKNTVVWAAGAAADIPKTIGTTYDSCSGGETVFTIHYYSDAELTTPMGDNPHLKPGKTYYLKIESSKELTDKPAIAIISDGTLNNVPPENTKTTVPPGYTPVTPFKIKNIDGSFTDSKEIFVLTRTITKDTSASGDIKEEIYIRESGSVTQAIVTNLELGKAFLDAA